MTTVLLVEQSQGSVFEYPFNPFALFIPLLLVPRVVPEVLILAVDLRPAPPRVDRRDAVYEELLHRLPHLGRVEAVEKE